MASDIEMETEYDPRDYSEDLPKHKAFHVGESDYSKHKIQPWDIWREYKLNPWEADIVKRVLRDKKGSSRVQDLQKIKHICDELIFQLEGGYGG